ncbi:precorrin-6y C5,15-methyltransferase (decarboxylating) subunit CbiE [Xanthobacter autotrophicus]|uniref:precorrin-6y C5,15-methyltransferase (decarboxylating) subunit CbiE n=1 Tax=Xanthobacter autotrophicus TaxID=280 RepID=UPI0024A6E258|nr:precorrin-6y C5,15-methyltransferase (decarboxylating) subunit CbiE [Xanthobacter autotrophicus]MDI4658335.1 precorrin-6y C5,15-methyltransferase (decarboxylating) subunit CbiE [Xanthobacter autotrophicus]
MTGISAPAGRWLSIVGIGEDGADGLSPAARAAISCAEIVFGGARHLALAGGLVTGAAQEWPSPFSLAGVLAARGRAVCVLASGDPFLYGVGASLARHVPADEMRAFPAPSAFALAAARLGWALQDADLVSLHGRPLARLRPFLQHGARLILLTSDGDGPRQVADFVTAHGCGASRLVVLEALGGPSERVRETRADAFAFTDVAALNVVALEVVADADAPILPLASGLPDDVFEHDGQITKREIRALTLSSLAPRRGELLWDIGAGAGSIAIEWLLAHPSLSAIAIEGNADRAARIARNAGRLGVPHLRVVEGAAPGALAGLPPPDVIFLGGGASEAGVFDAALAALKPGGRLVANAVTLETEAVLLSAHARLGGDLVRIALARSVPVKGMTGWRPAMPVTQWRYCKPPEGKPPEGRPPEGEGGEA